ncbi:hypothetical protein FEM03_07185 [Phragmitibacter flavus]|uniref:DUF4397 domain-containing protein n=1 Tax=Phragmitibacter flavus TaxID=2576071 RepID=A0A5R8KG69_9BACT|nr:hypothetical protein [Phragmitibacter flavus]TLD71307.1 hypothetical protein FEM03_07185 [Phragmitibacter flavus]
MKNIPIQPESTLSTASRWSWTSFTAVMIPALYCLGAFVFIAAQEQPANEADLAAGQQVAYVRYWAVLGDPSSQATYSLFATPDNPGGGDEKQEVFSGLKGSYRSGFGKDYSKVTPGKRRYTLVLDGDMQEKVAEVEHDFEKGSAYVLIAAFEHGKPVLNLIPEFPTEPEKDGIYIYNLLTEPALKVQIGNFEPEVVPSSVFLPLHIPAAKTGGSPVTLLYESKRKTQIRNAVRYDGHGRTTVVFMRDGYSRPAAFVYSANPVTD